MKIILLFLNLFLPSCGENKNRNSSPTSGPKIKSIDVNIEQLFGDWKVDSVYKKNSPHKVVDFCIVFHDFGGVYEGNCNGDILDMKTVMYYDLKKDTLIYYYQHGNDIETRNIRSKYIIEYIDSTNLTTYNLKTKDRDYMSRKH